ncbi:hypothetical protein A2V82_05010 [candidate division KSB1 bacterium RBG_16_48_16]|nr:MAG: hypothetical protein A2V82_05010 [candidate division KSB1 bacterium RBG_16_48_16]
MRLKAIIINLVLFGALSAQTATVPLYRVFERKVVNDKDYINHFTDVTLNVQYQAPSGRLYNFLGFYDGNGKGDSEGAIWKMRFMPDEAGKWSYVYTWSDGAKGGIGTIDCVAEGAGRGVLQPYAKNPHWFAYNGTDPVWIKSYYETGHGSIGQNFDWVVKNVYSKFFDAGYNHLQVNWLLSLCCFGQYYKDGPEPETLDLALYREGDLFGSMSLDVWRRMEQHLGWLNDHDIGVHMFLGVDGSRNNGPDWGKLSYEEKDGFVRYMVARLAPYANLAGWNFVWEVPGDREDRELGFARLIGKYDIFHHLRTYEDETPRDNEYARPEYTFAAVENHKIAAEDKNMERHLHKEPWTHHIACLLGYKGKPVFMSEGNALWRRYWQERTKATQDDLRRSAWACATAGAAFTWNGHAGEYELYVGGSEGLPFNEENPYQQSERYISILADVMENEVAFYRMVPHDELLADQPALQVYLLAEPGEQYLAFTTEGAAFSIKIEKGIYSYVTWIDAKTGERVFLKQISVKDEQVTVPFDPPNRRTDWALIVKKSFSNE